MVDRTELAPGRGMDLRVLGSRQGNQLLQPKLLLVVSNSNCRLLDIFVVHKPDHSELLLDVAGSVRGLPVGTEPSLLLQVQRK